MNGDRQPVPRTKVFLGAVAMALVLTALLLTMESLRHPLPEGFDSDVALTEDDSDPRAPIVCDRALPREGQEREGTDDGENGDTATVPGGNPTIEEDDVTLDGGVVTSNLLYDCPQTFDGQRIRYEGEVVGAVLERDGGAWVQLNDDVYAGVSGPLPAHRDYRGGNAGLGVFLPTEALDDIDWVGGPDARGDVLQVLGTFHRVDPTTGEVAVIRADTVSVAESGGLFASPSLPDRRFAAIAVAILAVAVTAAERFAARNR